MAVNLDIYVETDCANCDVAYDIADMVQLQVPSVQVSIIDLAVPGTVSPAEVFAVPTYLLNGRILSLGNPDGRQLVADLKAMLKQSEVS